MRSLKVSVKAMTALSGFIVCSLFTTLFGNYYVHLFISILGSILALVYFHKKNSPDKEMMLSSSIFGSYFLSHCFLCFFDSTYSDLFLAGKL
jgi:hypothetical protein